MVPDFLGLPPSIFLIDRSTAPPHELLILYDGAQIKMGVICIVELGEDSVVGELIWTRQVE